MIDKSEYKLYVLKDNEVIKQWGVAVGAKPGQKQRAGDMTTPTGNFEVDEILDASYWTHDFGDGKGEIKGLTGQFHFSGNRLGRDWYSWYTCAGIHWYDGF